MIDFIEDGHIYLKDRIITPSVSEILHFIFPNKYKGIPESILEKKAEYGSKVHKAIEILEKTGEIIELSTYQELSIEQYLKLKEKYNIEVIEQEKIVSYKYDYCGRFDMIAKINNTNCLCDIKTTAELDREYLSWQLSFYELAYEYIYRITFDKLYAIWLPKGDLGQLVEIKRKAKEELINKLEEYKMVKTDEYYGGAYPEPNEIIDCEDEEDFDDYYADIVHEEQMLGLID